MPRKIKVSDITPESNETPPINNDVEEVKEPEPVVETQEKQEEKASGFEELQEETPQEIQETPTEIVEEPQEETKTRNQELRQCPKCHKWLTAKTLKYFHECTKNDTVKAKRRPKKVIEVKDIDDPPPIPVKLERQTNQIVEQGEKFLKSLNTNKIDYTPPVEVSYEDMRRERIKQRIQQRSVKMTSLFANAI